jgi:hypothetical protein
MLNMWRVFTRKSTRSTATFLCPLPPPHTHTHTQKQKTKQNVSHSSLIFQRTTGFWVFSKNRQFWVFSKTPSERTNQFWIFKKKSQTKNWQFSWENEPLVWFFLFLWVLWNFCQVGSKSGYHENFISWVGSWGWVFHNLTSVDSMRTYIHIYITCQRTSKELHNTAKNHVHTYGMHI